jgi:hypothetical protein
MLFYRLFFFFSTKIKKKINYTHKKKRQLCKLFNQKKPWTLHRGPCSIDDLVLFLPAFTQVPISIRYNRIFDLCIRKCDYGPDIPANGSRNRKL